MPNQAFNADSLQRGICYVNFTPRYKPLRRQAGSVLPVNLALGVTAMGKTNGRYNAEFPVGMTVKIATENELINFRGSWRLHHPLSTDQIRFAGSKVKVVEVSYYHGGDELYSLEDVPGLWHECCLSAEAESSDT